MVTEMDEPIAPQKLRVKFRFKIDTALFFTLQWACGATIVGWKMNPTQTQTPSTSMIRIIAYLGVLTSKVLVSPTPTVQKKKPN
jgi:hypothetical protein